MSVHEPDRNVPPLPDEPRGWHRLVIRWVVALALAVQLAVPATYYLGTNPADERFAWRMFSTQRAEVCRITATEERTQQGATRRFRLRLSSVLHQGWVNGLRRRRPDIMRRFFDLRCATQGVQGVQLVRSCRDATGKALPPDPIAHRCHGQEVHVP